MQAIPTRPMHACGDQIGSNSLAAERRRGVGVSEIDPVTVETIVQVRDLSVALNDESLLVVLMDDVHRSDPLGLFGSLWS